jgi:hypothetical protein
VSQRERDEAYDFYVESLWEMGDAANGFLSDELSVTAVFRLVELVDEFFQFI